MLTCIRFIKIYHVVQALWAFSLTANGRIDTIIDNLFKIASLKSEPTCKLIYRIPGLRLLMSSLPGSASRMHIESLGKPLDSTNILKT